MFLREHGLDTEEVLSWIAQEELEYVDDLAHAFRSAEHIREEAPYMLEPWMAAALRKTEAWRRTTDFAEVQKQLKAASDAIGATCVGKKTPKVCSAGSRKAGCRPRPKPIAKAAAVDAQKRGAAARAAVELSITWAPRAGLAKGLAKDDPLLRMIREVHVERLAAFEPKGVWTALNNWKCWEEYHVKYATRHIEAETAILLAAFITGKQAATGPLAAWNQFDWARRHLKADIPLESVAKPPKKGKEGVVRENQQAVAMPPEFLLAHEDALEKMVKANDWRRVPVAASLEIAYSLVRIVHLGRSAFTHESAITYWLEAFRGKGKRQGARRAYTWAMIRHGLSGYDVAKVLYDVWFEWSEAVGYPLDYVVMDLESGVKLESSHIQGVMRTVAETFMPEPKQSRMIQPYSNRRFGGTLCSITKTPPTDIMACGDWAGVPELAKVVTVRRRS